MTYNHGTLKRHRSASELISSTWQGLVTMASVPSLTPISIHPPCLGGIIPQLARCSSCQSYWQLLQNPINEHNSFLFRADTNEHFNN